MARLQPGDPIPLFVATTESRSRVPIDNAAGRTLAICEPGDLKDPAVRAMLCVMRASIDVFDGGSAALIVLVRDIADLDPNLRSREPGYQVVLDPDGRIAEQLGLDWPGSLVVDRRLRVLAAMDLEAPLPHGERVVEFVRALPRSLAETCVTATAPVLAVPRVFEAELCRELVSYFDVRGGLASGVMREDPAGRTIERAAPGFKRRRDCLIESESLRATVRDRILRRLVPEIERAFAFHASRIERYLIAAYDAADGGRFGPHRDNRTRGTAHRRFAVSINLNAEDHEGGALRFPEYDDRLYRATTGGAVVFSCSILHEATPVTRGRRLCVLPFLYDAAAARLRAANADGLVDPRLQTIANAAG